MWEKFVEDFSDTSTLELSAFIFLVFYVFFATRQNPVSWLLGLVGVSLLFIVFYQAGMYAELPLQLLYFILSIYGWYEWKFGGKKQTTLLVTKTSATLWIGLIILGVVGTILFGFLLSRYTDTNIPYWDAGTTAFSLVGTWMLARKKLENWIVWLFVDSAYVWLLVAYKSLLVTALLYFIYVVFSVIGLYKWHHSMKYGIYPK